MQFHPAKESSATIKDTDCASDCYLVKRVSVSLFIDFKHPFPRFYLISSWVKDTLK